MAGSVRAGFRLVSSEGMEIPGPGFEPVKGLATRDAVPFLIGVLTNGSDWPEAELKARGGMYSHIARCYAALCLGSMGDPRAFNPLVDALQRGEHWEDKSIVTSDEKDHYHIADYAALGLGYLGDPNAVEPLLTALRSQGRGDAIYALVRLGDVRAVRPIIEYASTQGKFDYTIHRCLECLTGVQFRLKYSTKSGIYTVPDFPELGQLEPDKVYKALWQHWLKEGDRFAKRQFEEYYIKWQRLRQERPHDKPSQNYVMDEMSRGGIASLPHMIEHIDKGDESLIPAVSRLLNDRRRGPQRRSGVLVKENAARSECLNWWKEGKTKWLMFEPASSTDNPADTRPPAPLPGKGSTEPNSPK